MTLGPDREDGAREGALPLALKVGAGMMLADLTARALGIEDATLALLTTAFVAAEPLDASIGSGLRRFASALFGVALGIGAALLARAMPVVPSLAFFAIGLCAGALRARSKDYLFAAVAAVIVAFTVKTGSDPIVEVAARTAAMVLIGCTIGPFVAWIAERIGRRGG